MNVASTCRLPQLLVGIQHGIGPSLRLSTNFTLRSQLYSHSPDKHEHEAIGSECSKITLERKLGGPRD